MDAFNQAQMNRNINLVKMSEQILTAGFPCWSEEEIEEMETYEECPECKNFVHPRELKADKVCFHCIRKGL